MMNFGVQGQVTPRSYHRHLPGSAGRQPMNGKPQLNPITGETMCTETSRVVQKSKEIKTENANGVPLLNLNYLKDEDNKTGAIEIDLNDYSLDTPNSGSTVSWGTPRTGRMFVGQDTKTLMPTPVSSNRTLVRPDGVPELNLHNGQSQSLLKQAKQQSAWDGDPIPADLPHPSARYKQMYQQYSEEMKQSYRDHVKTNQHSVNSAGVSFDNAHQAEQKKKGETDEKQEEPNDGTLSENWTKQRYTGKQLLKKKDAEDLLEQNKKLKMVETVMVDQLSRAVISDPEQNDFQTNRPTSSRMGRGTNRKLHDSKVSTRATATENLLSRRVRFGARILTQNGHDALRELTGFFFDFDKTLTVYEFRQFGKSAKAMPFIYRGQYVHTAGPKQGHLYGLSDIYTGANVKIPTEGQLALSDYLAEKSHITLRITDVDNIEREALLAEKDSQNERLHAPSRLEIDNREYMSMIQDQIQKQICKRGIRTVTGLGRYYRKLDQYNTGILDQYDLEKGLKTFHINLDMEQLERIFEILDPEGSKMLEYRDYMRGVIGEMNEARKALVRKAFLKLDGSKKGVIHISDVKKFFNVNTRYKPSADGDSHASALQAFLDSVRENEKQEHISYLDFEEYYEGLSVGLENYENFANVLRNTWNI